MNITYQLNRNLTTELNFVPAAVVLGDDVACGGRVHGGHGELPIGVAAAAGNHRPHPSALGDQFNR